MAKKKNKKDMIQEELKGMSEKGNKFLTEFKSFILRGNVMDMAVGVIIGSAFSGIVTALTTDIINPLINGVGGAELGGSIKIYGGQEILYGHFLSSIINFILMAFVLFVLLKFVNKIFTVNKKKEEPKKEEPPKKSDEVLLLEEIRDLLKKNAK